MITIENLTKRYQNFTALENINLNINPGTIGLLGPNGAGKSTLIKSLLGLVRPQSGKARVLDFDIFSQYQQIRQHVGYMPENDSYISGLEGVHYVAYCAQLCGIPANTARSRAHEVLDFLSMGEERYRPLQSLSTGMRQKIKLAQAIVHDPQLVLLDEPTNGLDPEGREEMLQLIQNLWKKYQISFILSTHLLPDVEKICQSIVIIHEGKILAHDSLEKLLAQQEENFIIKARGNLKPFLKELQKQGIHTTHLHGDEFKIQNLSQSLPLFQIAAKQNVEIRRFQKVKSSLEEIFLHTLNLQKNHEE
ncbi:MAG: ABC transporter ATP-binding protein [Planctomycetota bacterium]|nr:MAG: ABC transporter ATP-binding protein [Planctomycetota bacterium]